MIQMRSEQDIGASIIAHGIKCNEFELGANITTLTMMDNGCAVGLGDGRVMSFNGNQVTEVAKHDGAVSKVVAIQGNQIISSGQDGLIHCAAIDALKSESREIRAADGSWVEAMAYNAQKDVLAYAVGIALTITRQGDTIAWYNNHPSTVTGIAIAPSGLEVAVAHYDGVTIWSTEGASEGRLLSWKGSIIGVSWSPNGRYVVASTQDREIHVWDLVSGKDFRFGGFKGKVRQIGWTNCCNYMVTTGSDVIAAWPLAGDPGSFPPQEIGYVFSANVSAIAVSERIDRLAGGFTNGSILIGNAKNGEALNARNGSGAEITDMAWNKAQSELLFGTRDGVIGTILIKS